MPRRKCLSNHSAVGGHASFSSDIHPMPLPVEIYFPVHQGEQGPVSTRAHVSPGDKFCSTLPNQDTAGRYNLSAITLDPEAFANAVASITNAALTFFVCHKPTVL